MANFSEEKREALKNLNEELGYPSATKLAQVARRRAFDVTVAQVKEFVSDVRQVTDGQPFPERGAHATNQMKAKWQMDLIDYSKKKTQM